MAEEIHKITIKDVQVVNGGGVNDIDNNDNDIFRTVGILLLLTAQLLCHLVARKTVYIYIYVYALHWMGRGF